MDLLTEIREKKEQIFAHGNTLSEPSLQENGKVWVGLSAKYIVYVLYKTDLVTKEQVLCKFEEHEFTSCSGWSERDVRFNRVVPFRLPHDFDDLNRCVNAVNALGVTFQQLTESELAYQRGWNTIIEHWKEICYLLEIYKLDRGESSETVFNLIKLAIEGNETARDILNIPSINITFEDWKTIIRPEFGATEIGIGGIKLYSSSIYKLLNSFLKEKIEFVSGNIDAYSYSYDF